MRDAEVEIERLRRAMLASEIGQYEQTRTRSLVSPASALQFTVEAFLGAGVHRYEHFLEQAWRYRDDLRAFLRERDAADPDSPHVLFLPSYMSHLPLEAAQIPRFRERPLPLSASIAAGLPSILLLTFQVAAAFALAFWFFIRLDLTG